MGAQDAEINSFVVKFKQLWKSGFSAHLDMDSCNGKAWLGIRIQLDNDLESSVNTENYSFSKERRRKKRTEVKTKNVVRQGETDVVVKNGNEAVEYGVTENIVELNPIVKNLSVDSVSETLNHKEIEENISVECIKSACKVENIFFLQKRIWQITKILM